jgi:nucleoside-diphosphate-sugar epimerase
VKIFVTGGTGFIGSHFLRKALAAGHEVIALRRSGSRPRIPLEREPIWVEGQLDDDHTISLRGCEALVHFAAAGVETVSTTWGECFDVNVTRSLNLWLQAKRAGVSQYILCGSCFEYGRSGERFEFIPVDAPLEPTGPYHASKAAASMAALAFAVSEHVGVQILRPFHVYGEGESAHRFYPSLRRHANMGIDFPMTLGEQVRDFLPVEACAADFLEALQNPLTPGQPCIRNLGSGQPKTLRAFAEEQWAAANAKGRLILGAVPYRKNEVMRFVPQLKINTREPVRA